MWISELPRWRSASAEGVRVWGRGVKVTREKREGGDEVSPQSVTGERERARERGAWIRAAKRAARRPQTNRLESREQRRDGKARVLKRNPSRVPIFCLSVCLPVRLSVCQCMCLIGFKNSCEPKIRTVWKHGKKHKKTSLFPCVHVFCVVVSLCVRSYL